MRSDSGDLRIGEFARRVGVSAELLRAWERRYGLIQPTRSPGGFRLYSEQDADRVARMRRALEGGLSAAEAARLAVSPEPSSAERFETSVSRLLTAIRGYDESGVQAVLDEALATLGLEALLRDLILPALEQIGFEWEQGRLAIGQEHFAINVIRGRLLSLARLWGRGGGPLALLACAPGEAHDIGLLAFGLVLRSYGWRILFLGADTPIPTITEAVETTAPAIAVLTSIDPARFEAQSPALQRLAERVPLALSGPGATAELCGRLRVRRLNGSLISAAGELAGDLPH